MKGDLVELQEAIARVLAPEPFAIFDEDCKRSRGITRTKMNVIGQMDFARKNAARVLEVVEPAFARLRAELEAAQADKGEAVAVDREAVAYLHTMHMEDGQTNARLSFDPDAKAVFGKRGQHYDRTYRVTVEPLARALPASVKEG